jgi:flagellar protein FliT
VEAGHPIKPPKAIQPGWQSVVINVSQFYKLTTQLIQLLESEEERDGKITQIESLMDRREQLMNEMIPPYTSEEIKLGQKIIQLNTKLSQLLQAEKKIIQKDIKALQAKKESNTKYVNPYQSFSTDGIFYDKRK